ncbi:hypothetical protein D3C77_481660 [compost metagenome]
MIDFVDLNNNPVDTTKDTADGYMNAKVTVDGKTKQIVFKSIALGKEAIWGRADNEFLIFEFKTLSEGKHELNKESSVTVSFQNGGEHSFGVGKLEVKNYVELVKAVGTFDFTQNISGKDYKVEGSFDLTK